MAESQEADSEPPHSQRSFNPRAAFFTLGCPDVNSQSELLEPRELPPGYSPTELLEPPEPKLSPMESQSWRKLVAEHAAAIRKRSRSPRSVMASTSPITRDLEAAVEDFSYLKDVPTMHMLLELVSRTAEAENIRANAADASEAPGGRSASAGSDALSLGATTSADELEPLQLEAANE